MNRRYRKTIIAGNWKMNKTASETKKFAEELKRLLPQHQVVRHGGVRSRRKYPRSLEGLQGSAGLRGRTECLL